MIVPWQRLLQNFLSDYFTASSLSLSLSLSIYIYIYTNNNMIVGLFGGLSKQWKCNDKSENICHNNGLRMVFQGHCEDVIQAQVRLSEWDSFTGTSYCFQWEVTLAYLGVTYLRYDRFWTFHLRLRRVERRFSAYLTGNWKVRDADQPLHTTFRHQHPLAGLIHFHNENVTICSIGSEHGTRVMVLHPAMGGANYSKYDGWIFYTDNHI